MKLLLIVLMVGVGGCNYHEDMARREAMHQALWMCQHFNLKDAWSYGYSSHDTTMVVAEFKCVDNNPVFKKWEAQ